MKQKPGTFGITHVDMTKYLWNNIKIIKKGMIKMEIKKGEYFAGEYDVAVIGAGHVKQDWLLQD